MKLRNKLVTLLCMAAFAICLAGCGEEEAGHQEKESEATVEVKDTEKTEKEKEESKDTKTPEEKVQVEAVELGKLYGQKYVNEYMDYGFSLGAEWSVVSYKDIYGIKDDILFGTDVPGVDLTEDFVDVYAEADGGANVIAVTYREQKSVTEAATGDELVEKRFDKEEELFEKMTEEYGAKDVLVSLVTVKVAGEKRKAIKADFIFEDGRKMILLEMFQPIKPERPYLVTTTIFADGEQRLEGILAMIKTPEVIIAGNEEAPKATPKPTKEPAKEEKAPKFEYKDDYEEFVCRLDSTGWSYLKEEVKNALADGATAMDAAYESYEVPLGIVNTEKELMVYVGHYKHSALSQVFEFMLNDDNITYSDEETFIDASMNLTKGMSLGSSSDVSMKKKKVEFAGEEHWAVRSVYETGDGKKAYELDIYLLDSYPYIVHIVLISFNEDRLDELLEFFEAK